MLGEEGSKRTSRRVAAIEAAKRIKKNAFAIDDNDQFDQTKMVTVSAGIAIDGGDRKTMDQVFDPTFFRSEAELMPNLSKTNLEAYPLKCEDMPKRRRGRPPKSKSAKHTFMQNSNTRHKNSNLRCKEELDYDVDIRRESYHMSLLNNEPMVASTFCGPKQLQFVNGAISYKESLMKFSKDLGPTARKVAIRMIIGKGLTYPTRHRLQPLQSSQDAKPHPRFLDVSPVNNSIRNTRTSQLSQPLINFGDSSPDSIAYYKGKNIMVDNGNNNGNKWDSYDNLELLLGKPRGDLKIGNGSLGNQDFAHKNLDIGQVRNRSTINQIGSFFPNYNGNLMQNVNKIAGGQKEDFWNIASETTPINVKPNSLVYPSAYVNPIRMGFRPLAGLEGGVGSSPWIPPPSVDRPPPVQPLQNWWVPPPETNNPVVVNDDLLNEQELQLALALNMQMTDQNPNTRSQNLWGLSQPNQFMQPDPHGPLDQLPPQDRLLIPMQPHIWSQMGMLGTNHGQEPLLFSTQQDFGCQMGNNQLHPPHGI